MRLSALQRARVFLRSLFIQAGFNVEGLQTLGLLYTLEPALKHLHPGEAAEQAALERHLTPFNTHPYVAAAVVGGIVFHEERIASGEGKPEDVARFKAALMGPLAALGDGFFWLSLRPFVSAVGVALVPFISMWAALVFLVLYNVVHFTVRARLFWLGLTLGDHLLSKLSAARIPVWGHRLRRSALVLVAGVGAWLAVRFGAQAAPDQAPLLASGCFGLGVVAVVFSERGLSPYVLLYGASALAIAVGAFS